MREPERGIYGTLGSSSFPLGHRSSDVWNCDWTIPHFCRASLQHHQYWHLSTDPGVFLSKDMDKRDMEKKGFMHKLGINMVAVWINGKE